MKNVEHEEWVSRSRFIHCPVCKNHTLKLKRVIQIGRCKNCNDSYKVITVYVKAGARNKKLGGPAVTGEAGPGAETTLPSWQVPSDASLFGASSPLSKDDYSLTRTDQRNKSRSTSG